MNTQCWDITLPPEEDEDKSDNEKENNNKGELVQDQTKEDTKLSTSKLDSAEEDKATEYCDTTGDTATASEDDEPPEVRTESKSQGLAVSADTSDMEITCVEKSTSKPGVRAG